MTTLSNEDFHYFRGKVDNFMENADKHHDELKALMLSKFVEHRELIASLDKKVVYLERTTGNHWKQKAMYASGGGGILIGIFELLKHMAGN